MGLQEVKSFFEDLGMANRVIINPHSSATVELAAQALGVEPQRIAKSLAFMLYDKPIIVVVAGDAKIDNRKYKDKFIKKAKMMSSEELLKYTGHEVGGVCPFALKDSMSTVYLDESLKRFTTVFPACGSLDSAIELSIPELEKYSNFKEWIDVTKDWQ
ncbi:MAG: YbaK/EbsC family protein [Bacilli bacterium]|jgi:prolyl-tRNA editing enzyme YbaK/EbsC (Cys-tRNA(Pro) deacylase)|nr:YbaK/EbsC family protein [Bacilli bacterium]